MKHSTSVLTYTLASADDDAALRALLQKNPIPGNVWVTFEREPSYFRAREIEGRFHQTLVARVPTTHQIVGIADRSVRDLYVNGKIKSVGYMSQFRVDASHPWGLSLARALAQGFEFFRQLHADAQTDYYLMSVTADNTPARRVLTAGLNGMPRLTDYTRYHTYAISLGHRKRPLPLPPGLTLERATRSQTEALLDCLQREGERHQFYPHWTRETLFRPDSTPDLHPEHVQLVKRGEQVLGALAVWDQSRFKQTIVRGYSPQFGRWRRLFNLIAPIVGWPSLPNVQSPIRQCFASHLAVTNDDPAIFASLLRAVYSDARERGFSYLILGLADTHPFRTIVESYAHVLYRSQLYLVAWDDGREAVAQVDRRTPGIEAAIL